MKKSLFLIILLIGFLSITFTFAQDDNQTLSVTDNLTDEVVAQTNDTPKTAIQTVRMNGVSNRYNGAISYSATFYDTSGNPIKDQEMWFTLDTSEVNLGYDVKTDSNGVGILTVELAKGNHYVTAYNLFTGYNSTDHFNVFDVITGGKNINMYYGDGKVYKVRVFDNDGNPVKANEKVTFQIANKKYTKLTDKNGYASFKIDLKPGIYQIYVRYHDFDILNTVIVNNVLKSITNFKSRAVKPTITYKVKFLGKNKKNKKIKVKFNKKTYTAKTNKKGIATFKLKTPKKIGSFKLTASYKKSSISSVYYKYLV